MSVAMVCLSSTRPGDPRRAGAAAPGLSPTGMYSCSLISSDRSLIAAPSRQKTPISEPSWLPVRMLGGPPVVRGEDGAVRAVVDTGRSPTRRTGG